MTVPSFQGTPKMTSVVLLSVSLRNPPAKANIMGAAGAGGEGEGALKPEALFGAFCLLLGLPPPPPPPPAIFFENIIYIYIYINTTFQRRYPTEIVRPPQARAMRWRHRLAGALSCDWATDL